MLTLNGLESLDKFIVDSLDDETVALLWSTVRRTEVGCWLRGNAVAGDGYSHIHLKKSGKTVRAHRYSLILAIGAPKDSALVTDHLCQNRTCVRPDHLRFVTSKGNRDTAVSPAKAGRCQRQAEPVDRARWVTVKVMP